MTAYGDVIVLGDGSVFINGGEPVGGSRTCNRDLLSRSESETLRRDYLAVVQEMLAQGYKYCVSPYHGREVLPDEDGWRPLIDFGGDDRYTDGKRAWCRFCRSYHEQQRRITLAATEGRELRPRRHPSAGDRKALVPEQTLK